MSSIPRAIASIREEDLVLNMHSNLKLSQTESEGSGQNNLWTLKYFEYTDKLRDGSGCSDAKELLDKLMRALAECAMR
ncbi:hypothetical protein ACTXT7_012642 [Hymenolepis weldensis]